MKEQSARVLSAQAKPETDSKYRSFILDSGANSSFVRTEYGPNTKRIKPWQVVTLNGTFWAQRATTITLDTRKKKIPIDDLVHTELPTNLLSLSQIVTRVGAILLDTTGAVIIRHNILNDLKGQVTYFVRRQNDLYHVPHVNGAICLWT